MTLPYERTRSVVNTRQFLAMLSTPYGGGYKRIPTEVRKMARMLLRHYPAIYDLNRAAKSASDVFGELRNEHDSAESADLGIDAAG